MIFNIQAVIENIDDQPEPLLKDRKRNIVFIDIGQSFLDIICLHRIAAFCF